ncbi:hypothetical protein [Kitasatospora sp. CB02891]|uniref:hypothetical protein n=1 Tax=Kitasatospora sp. CB02891 TaxID=2020329 RepID=UPI0012FE3C12|nr:hypothetical protein [Kitasatospora sp. CB02891]
MNTNLTTDAAEIAAVLSLQETPVANAVAEGQEYVISTPSVLFCGPVSTKTKTQLG